MADLIIAEDETNIREALADLFTGAGYTVRTAENGLGVLPACRKRLPDLVLLDVMMPRKDGLETLKELRRTYATLPVILLTALGESIDKVKGLGLGADDYIVKPPDLDELLARVARAIRRTTEMKVTMAPPGRYETASDSGQQPFDFAGVTVDPLRLQLIGRTRAPIALTVREVGILRLFARHPNEVLGREHLLGTLWGVGYVGNTRTLDQHMVQLRKKLGRRAGCLETVIGSGYRYLPPPTAE